MNDSKNGLIHLRAVSADERASKMAILELNHFELRWMHVIMLREMNSIAPINDNVHLFDAAMRSAEG